MSQTRIHFAKMHALANDFMVVDGVKQRFDPSAEWIREVGHRHRGVGFDQLLVLESAELDHVDFDLRIYNNDGSTAEQCGNGTLCAARFAVESLNAASRYLRFNTLAGEISATVQADGESVEASLCVPSIIPEDIPFLTDSRSLNYCLKVPQDTAYDEISFVPVSLGNPHAVVFTEDLNEVNLAATAELLQTDERFPASVNVEFARVIDRERIGLRVFERGAGETQACGTGACAAVTAANLCGYVDNQVQVEQTGGIATIQWQGFDAPILLSGTTCRVFEGEIQVE